MESEGEHGFDLNNARYIFAPVNREGLHWAAVIIDTTERVVLLTAERLMHGLNKFVKGLFCG